MHELRLIEKGSETGQLDPLLTFDIFIPNINLNRAILPTDLETVFKLRKVANGNFLKENNWVISGFFLFTVFGSSQVTV